MQRRDPSGTDIHGRMSIRSKKAKTAPSVESSLRTRDASKLPMNCHSDILEPQVLPDAAPSGPLQHPLGYPDPQDLEGSPYQPLPLAHSVAHVPNGISKPLTANVLSIASSPLQPTSMNWSSLSRHKFALEQFLDRETVRRLLYLYIDYVSPCGPFFRGNRTDLVTTAVAFDSLFSHSEFSGRLCSRTGYVRQRLSGSRHGVVDDDSRRYTERLAPL